MMASADGDERGPAGHAQTNKPRAGGSATMNLYRQLGMRQVINAEGTKTVLGGSLMLPEVIEAMREAAAWYVDLPELHRRAGKRIAELIDCPSIEDAAIVCGAA